MASFRLTRLATEDLTSIHEHIAKSNPAHAKRYLGILKDKCQAIAESPGIGLRRDEYLGLSMFPVGDYLIFYKPAKNGILVIRVLHGARDIENVLKT